jgi:hypothetical protein
MGQDCQPNRALSTALLIGYLKEIKVKIVESMTMEELDRWIVLGAYSDHYLCNGVTWIRRFSIRFGWLALT